MAGRIGRRIYKTKAWRQVRLRVFERDGFQCVKCGRRSGLECDHINPITKGGDWYDLENLRTVCRGCHIELTREAIRRRVQPGPRQAMRDLAGCNT